MDCDIQLKGVTRIGELSFVWFGIEHETVGKLEIAIEVDAMSGDQAAEQGRQKFHKFAVALAHAAENLQRRV